MNAVRIVAVSCFFALRAITADAGTAKQFVVVKDPQAVTVTQTALAAMGGTLALSSYQDSQASGTVTIYGGGSSTTFPVTLKCKGTRETRAELQKPNGSNVRIVNQGQGAIQRADGTVVHLAMNNTIAERVNHIPLLSILGEYQNGNISVLYEGTAQVNGGTASVIAVSLVPTTDPADGPLFASMTKTLFYINQVTGLIDKIQSTNYDEKSSNAQTVVVYLSNYQTVSGISVPFHQTTYSDGNLYSDLVLSNVSFNVGLSDSDFTVPQ